MKDAMKCSDLVQLKSNPKEMFSIREITADKMAILLRTDGSKEFVSTSKLKLIEDEFLYQELRGRFDEYFEGYEGSH